MNGGWLHGEPMVGVCGPPQPGILYFLDAGQDKECNPTVPHCFQRGVLGDLWPHRYRHRTGMVFLHYSTHTLLSQLLIPGGGTWVSTSSEDHLGYQSRWVVYLVPVCVQPLHLSCKLLESRWLCFILLARCSQCLEKSSTRSCCSVNTCLIELDFISAFTCVVNIWYERRATLDKVSML